STATARHDPEPPPSPAALSFWRPGSSRFQRRDAEQEVRVGAEAEPDGPFAHRAHAGEVAAPVEQVEDDLEVEVRRPAAVLARIPERADLLVPLDRLARLDPVE